MIRIVQYGANNAMTKGGEQDGSGDASTRTNTPSSVGSCGSSNTPSSASLSPPHHHLGGEHCNSKTMSDPKSATMKKGVESQASSSVSFDHFSNTYYDSRGVPYRSPLAVATAAYVYRSNHRLHSERHVLIAQSNAPSFTPNNPKGSTVAELTSSQEQRVGPFTPWRPKDSTIQRRALEHAADALDEEHAKVKALPKGSQNNIENATAPLRVHHERSPSGLRGGMAAIPPGEGVLLAASSNKPSRSLKNKSQADFPAKTGYAANRYQTHSVLPRGLAHLSAAPLTSDQAQHPWQIPFCVGNLTIDDPVKPKQRGVSPVRQPKPTREYLEKALREPLLLPSPQPLLVVFDLNGTLLFRPSRNNLKHFIPRPGVNEFLSWLMDDTGKLGHRHRVIVWSSARPENVNPMVDRLFTPEQRKNVVSVWARNQLGLTPHQYANKVQVYKELRKIWADQDIAASYPLWCCPFTDENGVEYWVEEEGWWDQSNTVLVDDSLLKASSEPHNLLQISAFENRPEQKDDDSLHKAKAYLEELAKWNDVSCYIKRHPFLST